MGKNLILLGDNKFEIDDSILGVLFASFETQNIQYAVLRGYESLPEAFSNDIDFGVQKKHLDVFITTLKEVGKRFDLEFEVRDVRLDVMKLSLVNAVQQIDIDIWSTFNYAGLHYVDASILSDTIYYNGIKIIKPEDELAISFLKEMLHMNRIRKDKIHILKDKLKEPVEKAFLKYFTQKNYLKFIEAIRQEQFDIAGLSKVAKINLIFSNFKIYGVYATLMNVVHFFTIKWRRTNIMSKLEKEIDAI